MKTMMTAAVFALGAAMPAFAASITIEFTPDDGADPIAMTFDDQTGEATMPDGSTAPYTWDEANATICSTPPGADGEVCATFEGGATEPAVGTTSAYTTSIGGSGTAVVTAIAE